MIELVVGVGEAGRVDRVLQRRYPGASRSALARLFAEGKVRVAGAVVRKGHLVRAGDRVSLVAPPPTAADLVPAAEPEAPLRVIYVDEALLAMDKPAGTPSHPLRAGEIGTVVNALVARYPECAGVGDDPREAGLVHRLDTDTTGVLVAARDARSWRALREAFADGRVRKEYLAVVVGKLEAGASEAPVAGLSAFTEWWVERALVGHTLVRCHARSGRRHQIRRHLAGAGAPIVGDQAYGYAGPHRGQLLHAARVVLPHPVTGRELELVAPLPPERAAIVELLARG
jgi:23S rRNA pseudouridine1911/1915/1917 synthase